MSAEGDHSERSKFRSKKAGLPPGTLIHIGKRMTDDIRISVIDYDQENFSEIICVKPEDSFSFKDSHTVSWINIDGLHDIPAITKIGDHFNLHPLLLEDIVNTSQRPKAEEFEDLLFLTLKMHGISKDRKSIVSEQLSFILGDNWLLSFQEKQGDIFDDFRKRLREGTGNTRKRGADYLLYRLLDTVVDNYFFVTEYFSETIDDLEEKVLGEPDQATLQEIQRLKRELIVFKRSVLPLREAVSNLQKESLKQIKKGTTPFMRDVYEHIIHVNDSIESQRDVLSSLIDLYHSGVSNRTNQVMQVLTIIATIFIPLTFIAGIYGMNFENMPELHWKYGYITVWAVMILLIVGMIYYFRRKKWL
jgi:magnesium transporter